MRGRSLEGRASAVLLAVGAALFAASMAHHATEVGRIDRLSGPTLAFALDGTLALAVVYAGFRLDDTDLRPEHRWRVVGGCLLGVGVLVGTTGAGILVRRLEGRAVSEPAFQLLLAAGAGAVAGLVAGYYEGRTRTHARRADRARTTLRFVNDLLRHDVKNHVSAIVVHADVVRGESDSDAVADSATVIREQADEITAVVENAGAVAEALSEDGDVGRVDLAAVVADAAEQVADRFGVTVATDLPDRAPVAANRAVESVVANLAENAAEHGAGGRRAATDGDGESDAGPRIELSVAVRDESVRLRVADDGPGVPDSRKADLFAPDPDRSHGGGLHLVRTLVESYGGDVRVEDGDAGGAAFVVDLPRADDE
ncbi:ATP-binding protein [Halorussus sp. AFM4]|uniref:ATP-binding protein n=1 Tax=Halorussus sp. AFM4 TaxID=3421651 RepID=UPI003EB87DD6